MKYILTFLAFASVVLVLSIGLMGADGVLQNVSGTTSTGSASPGSYLTNNQSTATTFSNAVTVDQAHSFVHASGTTIGANGTTYGNNWEINIASFRGARRVINLPAASGISWASTATVSAQDDIGLIRDSAGVLAVTNGSAASTWGDIRSSGYSFPLSATIVTLTNIIYTNVTLDFGSTATLAFSDLLVNAQNLKSNDVATICPPAISQTNGIFSAWVSNTVLYARYHNYAATAINPASGIFNIQVFQYK